MKRQQRRRIKRLWDKISCFSFHTVVFGIEGLPNTAVDVFVKVSEDFMFQYNLDMFLRWRLYAVVVVDGFPFRDSCFGVGLCSDGWLQDYFNDEQFEDLCVAMRNV